MIVGMEKAGVDHEALLDTYIRAINIITEGRPDDLTMSVHMCRGNFTVRVSRFKEPLGFTNARAQGGIYFSEGGYNRIAVKLFNTLDVDVFYVSDPFLVMSLNLTHHRSSLNTTRSVQETSSP